MALRRAASSRGVAVTMRWRGRARSPTVRASSVTRRVWQVRRMAVVTPMAAPVDVINGHGMPMGTTVAAASRETTARLVHTPADGHQRSL